MGWREVIIQTVWDYTGCSDARAETTAACIEDRLAQMPPADRIALARELLAGTGWTGVFRATGKRDREVRAAWNAAQAAKLGDEG